MPYFKSVRNLIILGLVTAVLYHQIGRAYVTVFRYADEYGALHVLCRSALKNSEYFGSRDFPFDSKTRENLKKSLGVELLACDQKELLKNSMLSSGVRMEKISFLELESEFEVR